MRKKLYQAIVNQLSLIIKDQDGNYLPTSPDLENDPVPPPAIVHFDLWNNNLQYIEIEGIFAMPAVFVEFLPIQWTKLTNGAREATVSIKLHIITMLRSPSKHGQQYELSALQIFDLLDCISAVICSMVGDGYHSFSLDSSATDCNHDELMDSQETYSCRVVDKSAVRTPGTVPKSTIGVKINT